MAMGPPPATAGCGFKGKGPPPTNSAPPGWNPEGGGWPKGGGKGGFQGFIGSGGDIQIKGGCCHETMKGLEMKGGKCMKGGYGFEMKGMEMKGGKDMKGGGFEIMKGMEAKGKNGGPPGSMGAPSGWAPDQGGWNGHLARAGSVGWGVTPPPQSINIHIRKNREEAMGSAPPMSALGMSNGSMAMSSTAPPPRAPSPRPKSDHVGDTFTVSEQKAAEQKAANSAFVVPSSSSYSKQADPGALKKVKKPSPVAPGSFLDKGARESNAGEVEDKDVHIHIHGLTELLSKMPGGGQDTQEIIEMRNLVNDLVVKNSQLAKGNDATAKKEVSEELTRALNSLKQRVSAMQKKFDSPNEAPPIRAERRIDHNYNEHAQAQPASGKAQAKAPMKSYADFLRQGELRLPVSTPSASNPRQRVEKRGVRKRTSFDLSMLDSSQNRRDMRRASSAESLFIRAGIPLDMDVTYSEPTNRQVMVDLSEHRSVEDHPEYVHRRPRTTTVGEIEFDLTAMRSMHH